MVSRAGEDTGQTLGWQFDALDLRPAERWLAGLPLHADGSATGPTLTTIAQSPVRLVDRYLDTEDWRIGRAGFVLRTRRHGRRTEATLREMNPLAPGGPRSPDITQALPGEDPTGLDADGPVGSRVHAVTGPRPLRRVLEVRTRRRPFAVRSGSEHVLDVLLDDTVIVVADGGRPVQLRRVQVRVPQPTGAGVTDLVRDLVDDLRSSSGLWVASLSKFDAGLLALGVSVPGPPDLGPLSVGPDATFGELAYATIRRQVVAISTHEPGTRLGEDPEELHDMRVATRRLRAALDLFVDALPARTPHLRAEVGWLAAVLGNVRDLDVQLGRLHEMEQWVSDWADPDQVGRPLERLRQLLDDARKARRNELLDALDSPRWERLFGELCAIARQGPSRRSLAARAPALAAAPALVTERHRAVVRGARRAARTGVAADFHRLRIRCKRLRYTLEFTADLYGRRSGRFAKRLARLQDKLGLMQDAEVATVALLDAATDLDAGLPALTIFAMGGIAERYRIEAAELLAGMPDQLEILRSDEWRELAALMERRQLQSLAAPPLGLARRPARRTPPVATENPPTPTAEPRPIATVGAWLGAAPSESAAPEPQGPAGSDEAGDIVAVDESLGSFEQDEHQGIDLLGASSPGSEPNVVTTPTARTAGWEDSSEGSEGLEGAELELAAVSTGLDEDPSLGVVSFGLPQ
jgi:CHAD domain-containing protein